MKENDDLFKISSEQNSHRCLRVIMDSTKFQYKKQKTKIVENFSKISRGILFLFEFRYRTGLVTSESDTRRI